MRNPDSIPFTCPKCGATTKANRRTGRIYSHQPPGELIACSESGNVVTQAEGGAVKTLPPLRSATPEEPASAHPAVDAPSTSVRTVPGGLPSLGKKR